jgi:ribonuclease BN (tRNA processing enzyme)
MNIVELAPDEPLSLKNDGVLEVFFLGVGSLFAEEHFQTNFLLVKGDRHVLVDFGNTGPTAWRATTRLEPSAINVILPSHSHDDHIGGLGHLALYNRYIGVPYMQRPKLQLIATEEYSTILWENSLRGNLEWNEISPEGVPLTLADFFDVSHPQRHSGPRTSWTIDVGNIHLELFRTRHIPEQAKSIEESFPTYGLYVDDRVFFSCDTQFDPDLLDIYEKRGVERYFHDVQFFPGAVHAPLEDLRTLPEAIRKKMLLTHYADTWREHDVRDFIGWAQQGTRYRFE